MINSTTVVITTACGLEITVQGQSIAALEAGMVLLNGLQANVPGVGTMKVTVDDQRVR